MFIAEHIRSRYPGWFRFISGTSVGAIIAAGLAMYPAHQFPSAVVHTWSLWCQIRKSRDVYRWKWWMLPLVPIVVLFEFLIVPLLRRQNLIQPRAWKWYQRTFHSLAHTRPLRRFLERVIDIQKLRDSNVEVQWAAVDVGERKRSKALVFFSKHFSDPISAILASASFPIIFELVLIEDRLFVDGGVRDIAPLQASIDAGADRILAILTRDPNADVQVSWPRWFIPNALNVVDQQSDEILWNDVRRCWQVNKDIKDGINLKHRMVHLDVIVPIRPYNNSLDFSYKKAKQNFQIGWESAQHYFKSIGVLDPDFHKESPVRS